MEGDQTLDAFHNELLGKHWWGKASNVANGKGTICANITGNTTTAAVKIWV